MERMIEVSEVFASVQGEGPRLGTPSVFVRTRRCPLACTWCDTRYTWDRDDPAYQDYGLYTPRGLAFHVTTLAADRLPQKMVDQIAFATRAPVPAADPGPITNLVITGGEPLLWQRRLCDFLSLVRGRFRTVEVETSGTVTPDLPDGVLYNVSPKLSSSGNNTLGRQTFNRSAIEALARRPDSIFKFVVALEDIQDSLHLDLRLWGSVLSHMGVSPDRIYLMPCATTPRELDMHGPVVEELAQILGWQYTSRLHVRVWGAQRGV